MQKCLKMGEQVIRWSFNFRQWQPKQQDWVFCGRCVQTEEKERISRFVFKKDAKAALVYSCCILLERIGRLMIRKVISDCLHIPYNEIKLGRTEKGKPYLMNVISPMDSDFSFNVSHQGDFVVLAARRQGPVGIDIMKYEVRTSIPDFFKTMERQFTESEWKEILHSPKERDQLKTFYRLWCLKESYVKALGIGIGFEVKRLDFQLCSDLQIHSVIMDTKVKVDGEPAHDWTFEEYSFENHSVAVAFQHKLNNSTANSASASSRPSFHTLTLKELISSAYPLSEPEDEFWDKFEPKDEAPRLQRR